MDIPVLLLGDWSLVQPPDGVGVDDGVEGDPVGGAVLLSLGAVHPEVDAGDLVPLLSTPPPRAHPPRGGAIVVVDPFQE